MDERDSPQSNAGPQLVIMAAGLGNRYRGLKQIDPVGPGGEVILEYSVHDALAAGFERVVVVLRRDLEKEFRERIGCRIESRIDTRYVIQDLEDLPQGFDVPLGRTKPWGTAHAVLSTRKQISAPFAVINADDFYGRDAFRKLGEFLSGLETGHRPAEWGLAGYRLLNTLSAHGHVSRGICDVDDAGYLTGIVERTCIRSYPGGVRYLEASGEWGPLSANCITSMNMWGFTTDLFDHLETAFGAFLETGIWAMDNECLLPTVLGLIVSENNARVRVLETDEQWFGVTYREDKPEVERAIGERCARGDYPVPLWS